MLKPMSATASSPTGIEQIRQECNRLQQETQKDSERVRQEASASDKALNNKLEALLLRSRQEAASVQQGANRYAEQVLGELDARLQEMAKVVIGGRRELVRLQNTDVELTQPESGENKTVSINRVRRSARRIKEGRTVAALLEACLKHLLHHTNRSPRSIGDHAHVERTMVGVEFAVDRFHTANRSRFAAEATFQR